MKLLGILSNEDRREYGICYVNKRGDGQSSVNGNLATLFIVKPGDMPAYEGAACILRVSLLKDLEIGNLLAFAESDVLLRIERQHAPSQWELSVQQSGFISVSSEIETWRSLRVGVLTVSDKASQGLRDDTAGPALSRAVILIGGIVEEQSIVPDEKETIEKKLRHWVDQKDLHLILVTGGTGLSERDVTPEALEAVAHRKIPGIGEFMRSRTVYYTPRSILSRGLAVTRGKSLIIAVPGSQKGALECFEAVVPVLRHGVEILRDWEKECGH
ncbi:MULTISPECIES: MogA/MoaB family molybdenum cofactor biosynthesis protein [Aminobacterium]|jgi:molybdopterin adenylyltransferase|nr:MULTISPECIES: MogA/MoaB family molybdenum cofactor biosynthesis protein [Aminobacterium]MDD2378837.1 MogA/MoaB family molybdenum cofactor biosynthesis protein [Aminobacterium colombiense]MDD3767621.1 MogA/MoaB family molybdenum cofactor biosynthesis protein [Aminobacterium colombiense]MDD4265390.1 MogA/MoaB family molybdenum cofactor biosynthesis protein [Aminobacterium colombiense]MDD4585643.1 MogA/MoaB family molybdenum cofactor biosynthesis protein [Aminobacterium colombiense]